MSIGASFARARVCRALKRMALFGVVFVVGTTQAAAQFTVTVPDTVDEGGRLTIGASATVKIDAGAPASTVVLSVTPTMPISPPVPPKTAGEFEDLADDLDTAKLLTLDVPANTSTTAAVTTTVTGDVVFQTLSDFDSESEVFTLTLVLEPYGNVGADGADLALPTDVSPSDVTINDLDTQRFEWTLTTPRPTEGGSPIAVTLKAVPVPVELSHGAVLSVDRAGYAIDADDEVEGNQTSVTLIGGGVDDEFSKAAITITPPANDGNREADTVTLRAVTPGTSVDRLDPLKIVVADIHGLPAADKITAKAYLDDGKGAKTNDEAESVIEGGDPVHVTITVDRGDSGYPDGEDIEVAVTGGVAQALDYVIAPARVTIGSGTGKKSVDFKLWASADEDVGAETLELTLVAKGKTAANGTGERTLTFEIPIDDRTTPMVAAKDGAYDAIMAAMGEGPLNPGDSFSISTADLFEHDADRYDVSYGAAVEGGAVRVATSGGAVTVTAEKAGEAKVRVTATARPRSSSVAVVTQTVSNTVHVTFPVAVDMAELAVTLSAPEGMDVNLPEGRSVMLTATANRPVEMDTVVELLQTEGTASPVDYTVEPIKIEAGDTQGTTMLTAKEDDLTDSGETLTIEGRIGAIKTNAVMFTIWDQAVPALPVIAQLLLAAFLAVGGYRRYLRR